RQRYQLLSDWNQSIGRRPGLTQHREEPFSWRLELYYSTAITDTFISVSVLSSMQQRGDNRCHKVAMKLLRSFHRGYFPKRYMCRYTPPARRSALIPLTDR